MLHQKSLFPTKDNGTPKPIVQRICMSSPSDQIPRAEELGADDIVAFVNQRANANPVDLGHKQTEVDQISLLP